MTPSDPNLVPLPAPIRRFDQFSRALSPQTETALLGWAERLGVGCTKQHVRYLAHRVVAVESRSIGRLAGDLADAVLRLLCVESIATSPVRLLEIGTLFGVNAALMHEAACVARGAASTLIIDPLDGYYGARVPDVATGLPISRFNVEQNFRLAAIDPASLQLLAVRSDDQAAIDAVRDRQFDVAFIDGDHSYEGVRRDWQLYAPRVAPGGVAILDNYRDGTCPGVDRFVDELVATSGVEGWTYLGAEWRTALFRKSSTGVGR